MSSNAGAEPVKRGRGRPPKLDSTGKPVVVVKVASDRKRGRPPRTAAEKEAIAAANKAVKPPAKYVCDRCLIVVKSDS